MEFHEHLDRIFALLWTPAHVERTVSALREGNADALVAALEGTGIVLSPAARVQLQQRAVKHAIKKAAERTRGKQGKVVSLHKKMQRMGVKVFTR